MAKNRVGTRQLNSKVFQRLLVAIFASWPLFSVAAEDKVSVIMPAWNRAYTISNSIQSVLEQSHQNWELVIVDDGSVDGTYEAALLYAQRDPRIRVFQLNENQGVAKARNYALDMAQGDFVAFLDSDDAWHPEKLEKQVRFMQERNSDFSFTGYTKHSLNTHSTEIRLNFPHTVDYESIMRRNSISPVTVMFRTSVLGHARFRDTLPEDWLMWQELLEEGHKAHFLAEDLADVYVSSNSLSLSKFKQARRVWNMFRQARGFNIFKAAFYFFNYAEAQAQRILFRRINNCREALLEELEPPRL